MYSLIRPLLFKLDAENAHRLTLNLLDWLPGWVFEKPASQPLTCMGIKFQHPLGLAAGLDKNAEHLDALGKIGFSFIEVGTVTPRPQSGNDRPRLFRLPKAGAIINRMGFNNLGVEALVANVQKSEFRGVLGINIGKNKDTPLDKATQDYQHCLRRVYAHASYVTINISSPNTPDLRLLQQEEYLQSLLSCLVTEQQYLSDRHKRWVPLVLKLSPDEEDEALKKMVEISLSTGIAGIIATNTTCSRAGVEHLPNGREQGGLSGRPLTAKSNRTLRLIKQIAGDDIALIGAGGIDGRETAREKMASGASLLQVYSGLIFKGPGLVAEIVRK